MDGFPEEFKNSFQST